MYMRKKKLLYNTITSLFHQIITILSGFILPKLLLNYYGSSINGLVSSITQFLGFVAFLELGVGAVVQSTLYKPLAEKDNNKISQILVSAEKFFRRIALIFAIYTIVLMIVYPFFMLDGYDYFFTFSLILVISISSFAQYYFGITNLLLLNADQMAYIPLLIQSGTIILNTVASAFLIKLGSNIQIVKLTTSLIFILRPLLMAFYVYRHYNIEKKNVVITEEPIKQKWNGLAQHLASVVLNKTDIVILTLFSTLYSVSVYSVYNLVVNGVKQIVTALTNGMQALFGNMIAKNEMKLLNKTFSVFEWLMHTVVTLVFGCTMILITPFAAVYTRGITDTNYYVPTFGVLIAIAQASYCLRRPYNMIVLAAGHYKQTQMSAIIEMLLNIIISIALVFRWGLVGVAIGTFIAMAYRTCYLALYLSKNILYREFKHFIHHTLVDILSVVLMFISTRHIKLLTVTYMGWIVMALKVFIISLTIVLVINFIFYRNNMKEILRLIRKRISVY